MTPRYPRRPIRRWTPSYGFDRPVTRRRYGWSEPETGGEEFVRRRGEFRTGGPLTTPIVQVDRGEEFIPIVRQHIAAGGGFDAETLADAVSRGLKALRSHAYTVGPLVDVTITYKAITRTNAQAIICDARESGQRLGITLPLVTRTGVP